MATIPGKWTRSSKAWARMKPEVRRLRREMTPAEQALWEGLRGSHLEGHRFRRQHPVGHFIVDFCCATRRLVVEVDGPIHLARQEADHAREAFLEERGYTVLRFSNDEVLDDLGDVLQRIRAYLESRM